MNRILKYLILYIFVINNIFLYAQKEAIELKGKNADLPRPKFLKAEKEKSFEDLIKDMEKYPGLFTIYWNKDKDKVYLQIEQSQLDKIFFCDVTRSSGDAYMFEHLLRKVGEKEPPYGRGAEWDEPEICLGRM